MHYPDILNKLVRRQNLNEAETAETVDQILAGALTEAQIAGFLAALATKGETSAELTGAARALRRRAIRVQARGQVVVDTCGTGGDGGGTFNISTTAALIVAGAGVCVAKHGNRSVSSRCGSADVLEALGLNLEAEPEVMEQALNEIGLAFLFAPRYHGAMRQAMPVRKQLGVRTLFNLIGPLANPAGATCQVLGVFAPHLTELFAHTLQALGTRRAMVVHGHDGLDEISTCAPTRISELKDGAVKTYDLAPERFFSERPDRAALAGGDPIANAALVRGILEGDPGPRRNIALLNAAAALVVAGVAPDFDAALERAATSIDRGGARAKLAELVRFSRGEAV